MDDLYYLHMSFSIIHRVVSDRQILWFATLIVLGLLLITQQTFDLKTFATLLIMHKFKVLGWK